MSAIASSDATWASVKTIFGDKFSFSICAHCVYLDSLFLPLAMNIALVGSLTVCSRPWKSFVSCLVPRGMWITWVWKSSTSPDDATPVGSKISSLVNEIRKRTPSLSAEVSNNCGVFLNLILYVPFLLTSTISEDSLRSNLPLLLKSTHPRI